MFVAVLHQLGPSPLIIADHFNHHDADDGGDDHHDYDGDDGDDDGGDDDDEDCNVVCLTSAPHFDAQVLGKK